jgi:SPP1 family predicted phage head-tail adaptor
MALGPGARGAGRLDRRVVLQSKTTTRDASTGEEIEGWAEAGALWMGKRDVRASERFGPDQVVAEIDTVFRARWSPALTVIRPETHRLLYDDRIYNIHGITELGRRETVEIACAARGED